MLARRPKTDPVVTKHNNAHAAARAGRGEGGAGSYHELALDVVKHQRVLQYLRALARARVGENRHRGVYQQI